MDIPVLLEKGDRGPYVRALQVKLARLLYAWDYEDVVKTHGRYTNNTVRAVQWIQRRMQLPETGKWDSFINGMTGHPTRGEMIFP